MSHSSWDELGLPPGSDRALIRKRYAQRLRDVQHDPAAFQRLREAYEYCLAAAGHVSGGTVPEPTMPLQGHDASTVFHNGDSDATYSEDDAEAFRAENARTQAIDRIAVNVLQRCTPLAFDPADLRAFVAGTPEFERLGLRETVGLRIAERIVEGAAVTTHAMRELAVLFGWDDVLAQRHGILQHPVLQDRLHQPVVPRRRSGSGGHYDLPSELPWIAFPLITAFYAFDIRGSRPHQHVSALPPWLLDIGPLVLVAAVAVFLFLEFRMMDYDARSSSKPLTPERRRNGWIARGALSLVVVVSAAATSRL